MPYKPPFARMRAIKAKAPSPIPKHPQNVEAAIAEAASKQEAGEEVAAEIRVPVGAVDAVITPGPDKTFGTPDDEVSIEAHKDDGVHEHDEPAAAKPDYSMDWKKGDLVALAEEVGVDSSGTKSAIINALDAYYGE